MARTEPQGGTPTPEFVPPLQTQYFVRQQGDVWMIQFDGAEYGPYKTEREALLFAIDAAQKLGENGQGTQVMLVDETGQPQPSWTFGHDAYPPPL
jgi:hypothetical protein